MAAGQHILSTEITRILLLNTLCYQKPRDFSKITLDSLMMRDPPAEPVEIVISPVSRSSAMELAILLCGRLPGTMKLAGLAAKPKLLTCPGLEKSSISSFKIIPSSVMICAPLSTAEHQQYIAPGHSCRAEAEGANSPVKIDGGGQTDGHTISIGNGEMGGSGFSRGHVARGIIVRRRERLVVHNLGPDLLRKLVRDKLVLEFGDIGNERRVTIQRAGAVLGVVSQLYSQDL